jgi:hypothetical protein
MSYSLWNAEQPCCVLWGQVVRPAKEDPEDETGQLEAIRSCGGVLRRQRVGSRAVIADLFEMHPDDLFRSGQGASPADFVHRSACHLDSGIGVNFPDSDQGTTSHRRQTLRIKVASSLSGWYRVRVVDAQRAAIAGAIKFMS